MIVMRLRMTKLPLAMDTRKSTTFLSKLIHSLDFCVEISVFPVPDPGLLATWIRIQEKNPDPNP